MEYYLSVKKNEIMKFTDKQLELNKIVLSEVTQSQETQILCFLLHVDASY